MSGSDAVDAPGAPAGGEAETLPWLAPLLRQALQTQRAHAVLLQGPGNVGQFDLALALAQAWLCEDDATPLPARPCGHCPSCRLVAAHAHADLLVVLPQALREPLGWRLGKDDFDSDGEAKAGKKKPSKEIRIEEIRATLGFASTTSARGRGKVVIIHPAERMNGIAANGLLKTLEEPAGVVRFLLCTRAADALLPTIRSRCQNFALPLPATAIAAAWLGRAGVAEPELLLAASGGQPQEALALHGLGLGSGRWRELPRRVAAGDASALHGLPLPLVVDVLQKLAHDAAAVCCAAPPRYFPAAALGQPAALTGLLRWMRELRRVASHAEHPWSLDLSVESLVAQGAEALQTPRSASGGAPAASLHSRS